MSKHDLIKYDIRLSKRNSIKIDGDWVRFSELVKQYGVRARDLMLRARAGRPLDVHHQCVVVVGGPRDGEWMRRNDIAEMLDVSKWLIGKKVNGHQFTHFEPDRKMQEISRARDITTFKRASMVVNKAARAFAILPRVPGADK